MKKLIVILTIVMSFIVFSGLLLADEPPANTPGAWIIYPDATPDHWVGNDRTGTGADPHTSIHEALGYSGQFLYPGPNNDDIGYWEFYNPPPEGSIIELRGEGIWQIAGDGAQGGVGREKQKSFVVQQNGITIRGQDYDDGGTMVQQEIYSASGATTSIFYLEAENITIENLHIRGNGGGMYAFAIGRYTLIGPSANADGLTITGNTLTDVRAMFDTSSPADHPDWSAPVPMTNGTVTNNTVNGSYYNIFKKYGVTFSGNNTITDNTFNNVGEGKSYPTLDIVDNTGNTLICNNTFNGWRSGEYAIYVANCTNPITICPTNTFVDQSGASYAAYNYYPLTTGYAVGFEDQNDYLIPVELTSFTAQVTIGCVTLSWITATETENLGFHVFRSAAENGNYAKITGKLIKGVGSSDQAHSYSYTDQDVKAGNTYYYKLADVDFNGNMAFHGPISVSIEAVTPTKYALEQSYPNPFNPETAINFSIKQAGKVSLKIYNLQGQLIRSLVDEDKLAGSYSVIWNGTDDQGIRVSSGTYLYTLKVNGFEATKKVVFMK